jgi:hypothetical protein
MYILSSLPCTPTELDWAYHWLCDMLHRVLLCLTAFLASCGILSQNGVLSKTGAQAQYLLGLGEIGLWLRHHKLRRTHEEETGIADITG